MVTEMLGPNTQSLLGKATAPLADTLDPPPIRGRVADEFAEFLREHNGFYAYESALHVFPAGEALGEVSMRAWNAADLWRSHYGTMADGFILFAEDSFGGQFALRDDAIYTFDPETGEAEATGSSVEDWAEQIVNDFVEVLGFPVCHDWQVIHHGDG